MYERKWGGRKKRLELGKSGRMVRSWCKSDLNEGEREPKLGGNSLICCAV